jgi:hypothetical protein
MQIESGQEGSLTTDQIPAVHPTALPIELNPDAGRILAEASDDNFGWAQKLGFHADPPQTSPIPDERLDLGDGLKLVLSHFYNGQSMLFISGGYTFFRKGEKLLDAMERLAEELLQSSILLERFVAERKPKEGEPA